MRALVVYESMFGNTRAIANAIAEGLATRMEVETVEVGAAPMTVPDSVDLVVVGGPTHAHGMTKPESRADSARRAGDRLVSRGSGVREWLAALRGGSARVAAVGFDTRIKGPGFLWGSAARGVDKELHRLGFRVVMGPESFLVGGPTGPLFDRLEEGEVDRARSWGEAIAARLPAPIGAR